MISVVLVPSEVQKEFVAMRKLLASLPLAISATLMHSPARNLGFMSGWQEPGGVLGPENFLAWVTGK